MLVSDSLEMAASELMTLEYHWGKRIVWREEMHRNTHTHQLAAKERLRMDSLFARFQAFSNDI